MNREKMPVCVVIVGDTHVRKFSEIPREMLSLMKESDYVIHTGDYISKEVFDGFVALKGSKFQGTCGNADPLSIRNIVPAEKVIEISGKRLGITHPLTGGPSNTTKHRVFARFKEKNVAIIIFGHTHHAEVSELKGMLMMNPGKGYIEKNSFNPPASMILLTIDKNVQAKVIKIRY